MDVLPKRKNMRLQDYDYSQNGAYFVTICTHERKMLLCKIVGEGFHALPHTSLSTIGVEVEKSIEFMSEKYGCIDKYVIMPNHIHMVVTFTQADRHGSLSLQDIIGRIKSFTTLKYNEINKTDGAHLWQHSYHEHIIRNLESYLEIWQYIDTNPQLWADDCYHN